MEKYYNPQTKKNQDLFKTETLSPVFKVSCTTPDVVLGGKGATVSIIVEAKDEYQSRDKAMLNQEFANYIRPRFNKENDLEVHIPSGLYVINKVDYYEGVEN